MDIRTRTGKVVIGILENLRERKRLLLVLSCIVVFITTYVLILPAFTLDKDEAAEQSGIDVPAAEQTVDSDFDAGVDGKETAGMQESSDTGPPAKEAVNEAKGEKGVNQNKSTAPVTLLNDESKDYSVAVEGNNATLSEGMSVNVREIDQSTRKLKKEYDELYFDALKAVQEEEGSEKPSSFAFAKFYDISLADGKTEVEPDSAVDVKISFGEKIQKELKVKDPDRVYIVHFTVDKETGKVTPKVLDTDTTDITVKNNKVTEAAFTADSFSVFAVVYSQLSTNVLAADGKTYKITVTYDDDAGIPEGTKLVAKEIEKGTDEYLQYAGRTWIEVNKDYFEQEDLANKDEDYVPEKIPLINIDQARFFDISLVNGNREIEPKAPVQVDIIYVDGLGVDKIEERLAGVSHFKDEKEVELIDDVTTIKDEDGLLIEYLYNQASFSVVGTYIGHKTSDVNGEVNVPKLRLASSRDLSSLGDPDPQKHLVPNKDDGKEDGTYTLSLSVTGDDIVSTETETKKSNVLFIMDRSSSMNNEVSEAYTRFKNESNAITALNSGTSVYGYIGGRYRPLRYSEGKWQYQENLFSIRDYDKENGLYYRLAGTRLAQEQAALGNLLTDLMGKNSGEGNSDNIEISIISFATYAGKDQTYTYVGGTNSSNWKPEWGGTEVDWTGGTDTTPLLNGVNDPDMARGTNWEEALKYAKEVMDAKKDLDGPEEDYYVIFLTDGGPTATSYSITTHDKSYEWGAYYGSNQHGGCEEAYRQAKDDALALVASDYKLYNIFTYGNNNDYNYMIRLTNYAYSNGENDTNSETQNVKDFFTNATTTDKLIEAFQNIFSEITVEQAYAQVKITDGLRQDAMTSTFVNGKPSGVTYTVTPKDSTTPLYTVTASMPDGADEPDVTFTIGGVDYTTQDGQVEKKTNPVNEANPLEPYDAGEYYSVTVDGVEYKMTLASVDENGQLTWDLSPVGMLLDDCVYKADFVVWPNQDAYDYVAALNNGLTEIADPDDEDADPIPVIWNHAAATPVTDSKGNIYYQGGCVKYPSIVYYPDPEKTDDYENGIYYGTFAVLTNIDQQLDYSVVTMEDGNVTDVDPQEPIPMELPDPMKLTAVGSRVSKNWNITRDPDALLRLLYEFDGDMPRVDENGDPIPKQYTYPVIDEETGKPVIDDVTGKEVTETSEGFFIDFKVLQDTDDPNAPAYKTVRLGWNEEEQKYVWYGGSDYDKTKTYGEGENAITLTYGTKWEQDFSIATGLMLTYEHLLEHNLDPADYACGTYNGKTYYLLEDGHDYTISEPELGYEFDFSAPKYHPMLVDGVMKNVLFTKNNDGSISISEIGNLEMAQDGSSLLDIINTLRGYIHVNKKVVDSNGAKVPEDDTKFTYVVTLHNDDGAFTTEGSHIPWYGISGLYYHSVDDEGEYHYYQAKAGESGRLTLTDEDGNTLNATCEGAFDEDTAGPTPVTIDGSDEPINLFGNQMDCDEADAIEGDEGAYRKVSVEFMIKQDQQLNIANVPVSTRYTITESNESGYEFVRIDSSVSNATTEGAMISGTIVPDSDTNITYTNRSLVTDINIQKLDESGDGLEGAVFQLKAVSEDGYVESLASDIESVSGLGTVVKTLDGETKRYESSFESTGELQKISGLPDGTYRLHEVYVPAGYISTYDYIQFEIADRVVKNVTTDSGDDSKLHFEAASGTGTIALLQITNEPGASLPSAGGPGTTLFYIFGSMLAVGCAIVLAARRRLRRN